MHVFEVDRAQFTSLARFNAHLADQGSDHFNNDLYIVAGFSHLSESELHELLEYRGYSIKDLGAIQKIKRVYDEPEEDEGDAGDKEAKRAEFYLYYDESSGVILFYTDMRKTEEIDSTVGNLLADEEGLHYLYVSPRLFSTLRKTARQETHGEVTRFIADRLQESDYPARIRPGYERTIQYHGDDGLDTLAEMETNYGVRPRNITFNITNVAKFRVVRDGVFALERGDVERFFEYVDICIEEAQKVKDAFDASSFEMLPATDNLSVPTSDPTTIELSGQLEYQEIGPITSKMRDEGFLVVDSFRQEGSVYFTSKVIDTEKQNTFRLRANEGEIRVFPQESESHLGSFLRFHEFVQNHVDPNASVAPVDS